MMLSFNDRGYMVVTNSWTMASKGKGIDICYTWGADGVSFFDSSTGTARCRFDIDPGTFAKMLLDARKDGILQL